MASHAGKTVAIWWIRGHDLRLRDNAALQAALRANAARILPIFLWSPDEEGHLGIRGALEAWIKYGLCSLDADLRTEYSSAIHFGRPKSTHIELALSLLPEGNVAAREAARNSASLSLLFLAARAANATSVFTCGRPEPHIRRRQDMSAPALMGAANAHFREFDDYLLHSREKVDRGPPDSKWRGHFGTLMPFYWTAMAGGPPRKPSAPPPPSAKWDVSHLSPALQGLLAPGRAVTDAMAPPPKRGPDWARGIADAWGGPEAISECTGQRLVESFVGGAGLRAYEKSRSRADLTAGGQSTVSRLSPYLRTGQVSPRALHDAWRAQGLPKAVTKTFGRRLYWRDLAYWLLRTFPHMLERPIRPHYADTRWRSDQWVLRAWQCGMTGFPLIDAAMRELWATGWIQQNVRMAVACFLTEFANLDWVHGARWFHFTLVDADPAINSMMRVRRSAPIGRRPRSDPLPPPLPCRRWQNAGRSGTDQWNFTIAPTSAASDPTGAYVRRWLPELAGLPTAHMHTPWKAPASVLAAARVRIGPAFGSPAGAYGEHSRRYQDDLEPAPGAGPALRSPAVATGPPALARGDGGFVVYPSRVLSDLDGAKRATWDEVLRMRRSAAEGCNDAGGYDVIPLPNGRKTRVFTRVPYRLPRDGQPATGRKRQPGPGRQRGAGPSAGSQTIDGVEVRTGAAAHGAPLIAGEGAIERALRRAAERKRQAPAGLVPRPATAPAAAARSAGAVATAARPSQNKPPKPPKRRQSRVQHFFS